MKILSNLFPIFLLSSFMAFGLISCDRSDNFVNSGEDDSSNLSFIISRGLATKGGGPSASEPFVEDVARGLTVFAFNEASPLKYSHYIPKTSVDGSTVKTEAPSGTWNLVMSYFRTSDNFIRTTPSPGVERDKAPLYTYTPSLTGIGNSTISSSAYEVFRGEQKVVIPPFTRIVADAHMVRNVALIQLVIKKSTMGIDKNATAGSHKVYLSNVPSTISYGGQLLRSIGNGDFEVSTTNPDVLTNPLEGRFEISDHADAGYLKSDTVNFIIPAHQGSDFFSRNAEGVVTGVNQNATDTTKLKMKLKLDLERPGGSRYEKQVEIPVVAQANKILRISITVNAGIEIGTEVLPWNYVEINENVGQTTTNGAWIYVKKGSNGTGLSWSDALGSINEGIVQAQTFKGTGKIVNGVLIAGGDSREYQESINVTSGHKDIRLYGGWEGTPGTELSGTTGLSTNGYAILPQTSAARKLATHKTVISGNHSVLINEYVSYIDGLKITGATTVTPLTLGANSGDGTVTLAANAVEITGNTSPELITSNSTKNPYLLNMLIADNGGSLNLNNNNYSLVNSTIVANNNINISDGYFVNCVFWGNTGTVSFPALANVQYSASDAPTSGMISLNRLSDGIAGPQFNISATPKYSVITAASPLLDNGDATSWGANAIPRMYGVNKDIDGRKRIVSTVDVGCYEYAAPVIYHPLNSVPVEWKTSSDWGYVGTFHRAAETNERLIVGPHTDGDWSAYVENGSDWITIDANAGGANGGVVENTWFARLDAPNAIVASGAPGLAFRVGLKSALLGGATSKPRYGTIVVTWRDNITQRQSRIYVRQGEADDYLYSGRTGAVKFSPFNLAAATFGTSLAVNGGIFSTYPSQCGGYFQWLNENNKRFAYAPSAGVGTWDNATPYYESYWTENEMGESLVVAVNYETCPTGYRRANDGATNGEPTGISEMRQSLWANPSLAAASNTIGGYYADGFFDKNTINNTTKSAGTGNDIAYRGRVFYNSSTNASLFFPAAGHRRSTDGVIENAGAKGYYWTSSSTMSTSATPPAGSVAYVSNDVRSAAVTIRCVKN